MEDFESSWASLLERYDLLRNDWLQAVYNARKQWAQSIFVALSLLQFSLTKYERALELSIEKEIEADYDTTSTTPVLKTRSPMEQQAANLYTKKFSQSFKRNDEQSSENQGIEKDAAISALREGGKKIAVVKKNVAKVTPPSSHASGNIQEDNMKKSPLPLGEMAPSLWPWQEALPHRFNLNDGGVPVADLNQPSMAPVSIHPDGAHPDNTVVLTCFKSMAWIIENKNSTSAGKVAVINLKAATI
ncbi:protein FAR1-RELATED SEQUENCE 3-like [Prunus yedoensis var. nudiflora]|uniref:Protein FAR1-RELATED SEQUENCE n=1 Tax=Prunus yedoensis var. nudiflora TaxID=2094558 RepID=A0A314YNI5_PRUYE|nr:protein FAR1-RELATED SEQUENCE 3-like [Prunus yedoensis var. nudiflora]